MLPFAYVLRNLMRRRSRTAVTIGGIALTTLLVIVMLAFASGLERASGSAHDDVVVLLGSMSESDLVRSVVARGHAETVAASVPGVAAADGMRAASVELHVASRNGNRIGLLRGITPSAWLVHRQVVMVEGREPRGPFELAVGRLAATRMDLPESALAVGSAITLENREFRVVGRFAAPGSPIEAEMWTRLEDLMVACKREDVSCIMIRLADPAALGEVRLFAARRLDLEVGAMPERDLLAVVEGSMRPVTALARWMAALAVVAGAMACANTMFAAVLARTRELATLRALGWSQGAVGFAMVQESLLVALVGGGIGCLAALAIGSVSLRYPMGALMLELDVAARGAGLLAALASGLLGGILPAVRAVRVPLLEAIGGRQ